MDGRNVLIDDDGCLGDGNCMGYDEFYLFFVLTVSRPARVWKWDEGLLSCLCSGLATMVNEFLRGRFYMNREQSLVLKHVVCRMEMKVGSVYYYGGVRGLEDGSVSLMDFLYWRGCLIERGERRMIKRKGGGMQNGEEVMGV